MLNLIIASLLVYLFSAVIFLFPRPRNRVSRPAETPSRLAAPLAALAGLLGVIPAFACLLRREVFEWRHAWALPFGELHLHFDALSAWFAILLFAVAFLGAWHGGRKPVRDGNWSGYFLLCAGMLLLLLAWDAVLFLIAWEIMSVAAWILVMNHHERPQSRRAGWYYFIVTHASTACLMLMFMLFWVGTHSFSFSAFRGVLTPATANAVFVLAVLGFGSKAGFCGSHLWMPEAYNAATGHNAALLSAIMSKLSFYALLRFCGFMTYIPEWWGEALMLVGTLTALTGIVYSLMQKELKRLLAYSSMENLGLICLALGFALLGATRHAVWGELALCGLLFHIWHHGISKTGLFLCAGNVAAVTHGAEIDSLGGLRKHLPRTALAFAVCATAICSLPPLSGFAGEYLMVLANFVCLTQTPGDIPEIIAALGMCAVIALIGGLAAFAMIKAYSTVFLGMPRSNIRPAEERDYPLPALAAAGLCITLGISWWLVFPLARPVTAWLYGSAGRLAWDDMQRTQMAIALFFALFGVVCLTIIRWRSRRQAKREITQESTWACGFSMPNAHIQYTGTSFVQPLTDAFKGFLRPQVRGHAVNGYFPENAAHEVIVRDQILQRFFRPLFHTVGGLFARLRIIQHGETHLYIFYIILALAAAMVWALTVK